MRKHVNLFERRFLGSVRLLHIPTSEKQNKNLLVIYTLIGTFRFYEEENEYEIRLPVFDENTLKIYNPVDYPHSLLAV